MGALPYAWVSTVQGWWLVAGRGKGMHRGICDFHVDTEGCHGHCSLALVLCWALPSVLTTVQGLVQWVICHPKVLCPKLNLQNL
jgi:hypothetical protein